MEIKKENNALTVLKQLVSISSYGPIGKEHQIIKYLRTVFNDCCDKIEIEDKNGNRTNEKGLDFLKKFFLLIIK